MAQGLSRSDMWNLPGPGIKLVSLALAGGFLSTVPPGSPRVAFFIFLRVVLSSFRGK